MRYATIVADPPWQVKRPNGWHAQRNSISQPYPTMSADEIAAIEVPAADSAWLFLWTVNAHVENAYAVVRAWGFRPVTLLVWCKEPRGVGPGSAFPTTAEFVIYARKGAESLGRLRLTDTSWFTWPRRAQSEKPPAFLDLVESGFPGPYLELFARRQRLGWDTWGNEALEHVTLDAPALHRLDGCAQVPTIRVSLTYEEAEALLSRGYNGDVLHEANPVVHLHARGKLIDHLLRDPDYVPPAHRERVAGGCT